MVGESVGFAKEVRQQDGTGRWYPGQMTPSSRAVLALAVLVALLAWPREAILGTYGTYLLPQHGYTLARAINVGSYSEPDHEDVVFHQREAAIDAQVKPLLALYKSWYERVFTQPHPYSGWLGAIDRERATKQQWDYRARLPGPTPLVRRQPADVPALDDSEGAMEVYVHMKPQRSPLAHGRALVGFALAQAFLGDGASFKLPQGQPPPLAQRLARAAHGDFFSGQSHLLAALLFDVRPRQPELVRFVEDKAQTAELRLLASLVLRGLRHEPWTPADWQRLSESRTQTDVRTLWTWALLLAPAEEQPAREAELRQRLPLSDEYERSYYREFVQGKVAPAPTP